MQALQAARPKSAKIGPWTDALVNPVTQAPAGRFAPVSPWVGRKQAAEDYLVVEEDLPAGGAVIPGSVSGDFDAYEARDGKLVFDLGERRDADGGGLHWKGRFFPGLTEVGSYSTSIR